MIKLRIKKLILLLDNLFCERDYHRFGIELLKANGFEVLVWELTPIINSDIYNNITVPDPIKYEGHRIFYDTTTIQNNILNLDHDCLFIIIATYCANFYKILRAISRKKLPYCFDVSGGCYPHPIKPIHKKSKANKIKMIILKLIDNIKKSNYKLIRERIYKLIPFRLLFIKPADFIIVGGAKSNMHLLGVPIGPKTNILTIHQYDYDNYLSEMRKANILDQTTGVFLDQYAAFHPDNFLMGDDSLIEAEEYYPDLRKLFDYLECTFKVKIIIAAHPRSHYEDRLDYFGGRPVIRNKTCELVRRAGFVIVHHSTSIGYAVLFNKPILFLTSDEFERKVYGPYINVMSNILGKKPIFMDKPYTFDWEKELIVDTARYHEYKQNHIKMEGSEELPFWQIVANYIKSNY